MQYLHVHTSTDVRSKFLFLLASAREGGNTETLTRIAAEQLPASTDQRWIRLRDVPLPAFEDVRHSGTKVEPTENERLLLAATLDATDIVIASPLYWYSVSADAKQYLDYWSGWLRLPEFKERMKDKTLWGVSVLSEENPAQADPLVGTLRLSAEYLHMNWGGVLLGNGSRPDDVLKDTEALPRAKNFFR